MESWYLRNKETVIIKQKAYKSTPEFKAHRLEQDRKNRDHINKLKRIWRHGKGKQKDKISKQKSDHKYWNKKKHDPIFQEKQRIRHAKYSKENPEKLLKNSINRLKKMGLTLNMTHFAVGMALKNWSQSIRKNNPLCFCGNKADVTHHLLYKQLYPKLMLNVNNGIPLCTQHHREVHGQLLMVGRD